MSNQAAMSFAISHSDHNITADHNQYQIQPSKTNVKLGKFVAAL